MLYLLSGFHIFFKDIWSIIDFVATIPFIASQYFDHDYFDKMEFLVLLRIFKFLFYWIPEQNQSGYFKNLQLQIQHQQQDPENVSFLFSFLSFTSKLFNNLALVVDTFISSLMEIIYTITLLIILLLILSVMAVDQCGKYSEDFNSITSCMWSFVTCITMDGWVDIASKLRADTMPVDITHYFDQSDREMAYVFGNTLLVFMILIGGFIFNNLFVAIVVSKLDVSFEQEKKLENTLETSHNLFLNSNNEGNKDQKNSEDTGNNVLSGGKDDDINQNNGTLPPGVASSTLTDSEDEVESDNDDGNVVPILPFKDVKKIYRPHYQLNLNTQGLKKVNIERLEDYFTLVYALENNLVEYLRLRNELHDIVNLVYELNKEPENHEIAMEILGVKNEYRESRMDFM